MRSLLTKFSSEYRVINSSGLFDVEYYLSENPDVKELGIDPIIHYIKFGEAEGRLPHVYCDIEYLKSQINNPHGLTYFAYFCLNERKLLLSMNRHFDIRFYIESNSDIENINNSPFEHFLHRGIQEQRQPSPNLDSLHYFGIHDKLKVNIANESGETLYTSAGPFYEEPKYLDKPNKSKVKALAYYLPQFHPFEENNTWWGEGFTEWTNCTKAVSRFPGHYQPHLPKHLGYYDLRVKDVLMRQVDFAKAAGLFGFCFYYYWFNGKRLMEKPINLFLENQDIQFPFCIMWANENWTRAWDGKDKDVLISQDYREEDDADFIRDLGKHFADKRYIRIDGRPLFFIYRPAIIPNAKEVINNWRQLSEELLNEKPLFYMAHAFGQEDPDDFGMDGAIEFPPHKIAEGLQDSSRIQQNISHGFTGHYPSYDDLVKSSLDWANPSYPLIRGVTPTWDNEARRPNRGMGFLGSTPEKYKKWLWEIKNNALHNPISSGESFVVINAWNEWAEGAHLEPDVHYGAAYINATFEALNDIECLSNDSKLLLVGHDAHRHGAQLLTLNIFKTLKEAFGVNAVCILLDGGPLVENYKEIGEVFVAGGEFKKFKAIIEEISFQTGICGAICNTTVTGDCVELLSKKHVNVISLIHELPTLINEYQLTHQALNIAENANNIIFAAEFVQEAFSTVADVNTDKALILPQGIYQALEKNSDDKNKLREKLGIPLNAKVVINSGFADLRKGFDLFLQIAKETLKIDDSAHFVWLGNVEGNLNNWVFKGLKDTRLEKQLHIIPFTNDVSLYLSGADVFAMTSREDPFPSVVLEALALGTPVVGFEGGGGFTEVINNNDFGKLVPMADCSQFAEALLDQIHADNDKKSEYRASYIRSKYNWDEYVYSLLELAFPNLKKVSVVIPNYNYGEHIEERLNSVLNQTYPIHEIIILDDKSTDNSLEVINRVISKSKRKVNLIVNEANTGSVFKQWAKASQIATGEYLWIAEADDSADKNFLMQVFKDTSDFTMAYTDSQQIDELGKSLASDYKYYYDPKMLNQLELGGTFKGKEILENCLSIKNQFMNVSSIVFNRNELAEIMQKHMNEILNFKVAGDWFIYIHLLSQPNATCKLINQSLNIHRRHQQSVTHKNLRIQLNEINNCQNLVRCDDSKSVKEQQKNYLNELKKLIHTAEGRSE